MNELLTEVLAPLPRQSLADELAQRVKQLISAGGYEEGDRLPAITEMARHFGVGHPTVREALSKLATVGAVDVRHGSGVYVGRTHNTLLVSNPTFDGGVSKKLLLDLIEARIPVELRSAALAANHATDDDLQEMTALLEQAGRNLHEDVVLSSANMAFHQQIAIASGNTVIAQILEVLSSLFRKEQRMILNIYGSRSKDHAEHMAILEALRERDGEKAVALMCAHLEGVQQSLLGWDPTKQPIV